MKNKILVVDLKEMIENNISQRGTGGTRYYRISRDQLEEIIAALEN